MSNPAELDQSLPPELTEARDFLALPVEQRYKNISHLFSPWLLTDPIQFPSDSDVFVWTRGIDDEQRASLDLAALPEPLRREIRYGLYRHSKADNRSAWRVKHLQEMIAVLAELGVDTLHHPEVDEHRDAVGVSFPYGGKKKLRVWRDLPKAARPLSVTPELSKEEGWFDPVLNGGKPFTTAGYPRREPFDLTAITQRWLRDLTWDWLLEQSLNPKRVSGGQARQYVRSIALLSHLLRHTRADDGEYPERLDRSAADAVRQAWDWYVTEQVPMPQASGEDAPVSERSRADFTQSANKLLHLLSERLPESCQSFLSALPSYEKQTSAPNPRPLSNDTWEALTSQENIDILDRRDARDAGYADAWLEHAFQGGRMGESLQMRLGCIAMVGDQPFIWRNQSKTGDIAHGMACHYPIYQRLMIRQQKTRAKLRERYADKLAQLSPDQQLKQEREWDQTMPLYPRASSNPDLTIPISTDTFKQAFASWIKSLDLDDHVTTHRTRHTIATALLNNGAPESVVQELLGWTSPAMIRQYGQFSDEHRIKPMLQVWTAGPGMPTPGKSLMTPTDFPGEADQAAIQRHVNLSIIPVDHGLCQYGPVVGGAECPFNKNCTTDPKRGPCEHFALTGADYSYWNRKYEAAVTWAEGAPTEETRDYILDAWSGWSDALDGLRETLDGLGLLESAEALDLRSPHQDYLDNPVWTTGIPFADLINPTTESVIDIRDHQQENSRGETS